MESIGVINFILLIAIFLCSFNAFRNQLFFDRWTFVVDEVLIRKDYKRLITSGFIHVNWLHLIMNMLALYSFSEILELRMGYLNFILIYFGSLIGGNLFSLYVHRNHGDYSAAGASGAISGVIFSYIVLYPHSEIGIIGIYMPSWLYGILFVFISLYGIKTRLGNIGHDAHLGGALVGLLFTCFIFPEKALDHFVVIASITLPCILFILLILKYPAWLLLPSFRYKSANNKNYTFEDKFNAKRILKQKEIDRILDKINQKGIESLNKKEKQMLDQFSEVK